MSQVTEFLAMDHEQLQWELGIARHAAQMGRWLVCRRHFRLFCQTLMRHIVVDEDSLFPAVAGDRLAPVGTILMMRIGEEDMSALIQKMQAFADHEQPEDFIRYADQLLGLLKQYQVRETAVIDQFADHSPAEAQAQLLEDVEGLLGEAA